jgi:hypothetical protein
MRPQTFFLAAAISTMSVVPAIASGLSIPMDEARIVKFSKPVATVFVANPTVADVNTIDSTHVFVLGKAFGGTNLVALDAKGNQIESEHVTVIGSNHLVTLNRGSGQFTFACATARCETAAAPGDVRTWHDDNLAEIERREDNGAKQASPGEGNK